MVPAVAGCGDVARGFGFIIGASEGCGGGVASCRSSFNTYVPGDVQHCDFSIDNQRFQQRTYLHPPPIGTPVQTDGSINCSSQSSVTLVHLLPRGCTQPGKGILEGEVGHCVEAYQQSVALMAHKTAGEY